MIKYDDIKTRKGLFPEGLWHVEGSIVLQSTKAVTKEEFENDPVTLDHAAQFVRQGIWSHIYGELFDPIKELQRFAICSALPGEEERIAALCDTINKLLRLP